MGLAEWGLCQSVVEDSGQPRVHPVLATDGVHNVLVYRYHRNLCHDTDDVVYYRL